jgi:hypothetical protein
MDLTSIVLYFEIYLQIYKRGIITICTSQIQPQNVNYLIYCSVVAVVLAGFSCSGVWWGARALVVGCLQGPMKP